MRPLFSILAPSPALAKVLWLANPPPLRHLQPKSRGLSAARRFVDTREIRMRRLILTLSLLAPFSAAAEISLSGEAKMGLTALGSDVQAFSVARVTGHAYGITDGGMEYGAVFDLDTSRFDLDLGKSLFNDETPRGYVYISGGSHGSEMEQDLNSAAR